MDQHQRAQLIVDGINEEIPQILNAIHSETDIQKMREYVDKLLGFIVILSMITKDLIEEVTK